MGDLFNLRKQLAFYGAYHSNPLNQLVHIVFVPLILGSAIMLLCHQTDLSGGALLSYSPYLVVNAGLAVAVLYGGYYAILDPIAGSVAAALVLGMWVFGNFFQQHYPQYILPAFFIGQIGSWTPQILAHKYIEGRAPALFDNLAQAFLLAPFFVFLEVLFKFGYRPALHKDVVQMSQTNIDAWKKSSAKKQQ